MKDNPKTILYISAHDNNNGMLSRNMKQKCIKITFSRFTGKYNHGQQIHKKLSSFYRQQLELPLFRTKNMVVSTSPFYRQQAQFTP